MDNTFKKFMSLKDAAMLFNKDESTLRRNIKNRKFVEGIDCKKFGKQWVFDIDALERVYGPIDTLKRKVIWLDNLYYYYKEWRLISEEMIEDGIPGEIGCEYASVREDFSNFAELSDEISYEDMSELEYKFNCE